MFVLCGMDWCNWFKFMLVCCWNIVIWCYKFFVLFDNCVLVFCVCVIVGFNFDGLWLGCIVSFVDVICVCE